MEEEKTEGLLLQATPLLGSQKILKVLTSQGGMISLVVKKKELESFTTPFLIGEWVYQKGKKEIHTLKDATLYSDLAFLKLDYASIFFAGQIAQELLKTQYPEKNGTALYSLTCAYLRKSPEFIQKETLLASFRLKLFLHDGHLALQRECSHCGDVATSLTEGESLCKSCAPLHSTFFSPEEWETLHILTFTRKFNDLQPICIDSRFQEKIQKMTQEMH